MIRKLLLATAVLGLAFLATAQTAQAEVILTLGQKGTGTPITATVDDAAGTTTIKTTGTLGTLVTVTQILDSISVPFDAFLIMTATSTNAATLVMGFVVQEYSGSFSVTANSDGTGTNYLSGTFTDAVFGLNGGAALTLTAADPPESIVFTSDIIPTPLGEPRGVSFAFAAVLPLVHIEAATGGDTLGAFDASVAATFSATVVPEPATMALLLAGLPVVAGAIYRRRKMAKA